MIYGLGVAIHVANNYILHVFACVVIKHGLDIHAYYKNDFNMNDPN